MSLFTNLVKWAQGSSAIQAIEKQAITAVTDAVQSALHVAIEKAPDMQSQLETHAASFVQAAIAGIATQTK